MTEQLINKSIPPVPRSTDQEQLRFLAAVKEALDTLQSQIVISKEGIVSKFGSNASKDQQNSTGLSGASASTVNEVDFRTPAAVTSVAAAGTIESILVTWDYSGSADLSMFEIYRATGEANEGVVANAALIGTSVAEMFADAVTAGSGPYYYWVRGVSTGGTIGPFQGVNGAEGNTVEDPLTTIMNAAAAIGANAIATQLASTGFGMIENASGEKVFGVLADRFVVLNQDDSTETSVPFQVNTAGEVLLNTAVIGDASITSAMIGSLNADKISAVTGVSSPFADIGTVTAGTLKSSDGKFEIDLDAGVLTIKDANNNVRLRLGDL